MKPHESKAEKKLATTNREEKFQNIEKNAKLEKKMEKLHEKEVEHKAAYDKGRSDRSDKIKDGKAGKAE